VFVSLKQYSRFVLLTLSILGLTLSASGYSQTQCGPDNTLVTATIDKPVNMDPAFSELYASMQVYQNVFAKLVSMDTDYSINPDLASHWEQESETEWTFYLVQNATFHNGEPVSAHDVKYSIDRIKDPELGASNAVFLQPVTGVEVVDDYTVKIYVEEGWGGLLPTLALVGEVVSERAINEADPRLNPIGAGPYEFVEWVPDDHVLLRRHEGYHGTPPDIDCIEMRAVSEDSVRLTGLLTGEFGWIEQVPLQRAEALKNDDSVRFHPGGPYLPDLIIFNNSRPPFNDVRVRQAVAWALDREAIANIIFFGQAVPATEAIPPVSPLYSGVDPYAGGPDLERARALIEEAGAVGTTVVFAGQPQVASAFRTGQILQEQLRQIGLNVEIQSHESSQWFQALAAGDFDFTVTFWSATADPEHAYFPLLHSTSPWNFARYANENVDAALEKFRYTSDPEARQEAYRELIAVVNEEAPILFTINKLINYWTTANIAGATPRPTLELRFDQLRRE
jgi:peptide/nickel transport system substrate-binding protein